MTFHSKQIASAIILASSCTANPSFASDFYIDADLSSTKLNKYGQGRGSAIGLGLKVNETISIDGGYRYVGRVNYNDFPVDVSMWFLSSSIAKKVSNSLSIYGKIGIGFAAIYVKKSAFSRESLAPFAGIGIRNSITKDVDASLEIYTLAGIANGIAIGVRYNF